MPDIPETPPEYLFDRLADFRAVLDALAATLGHPPSEPAASDDLGNEPEVTVELAEAPKCPGVLVVGSLEPTSNSET